jgi:hypothetical protein
MYSDEESVKPSQQPKNMKTSEIAFLETPEGKIGFDASEGEDNPSSFDDQGVQCPPSMPPFGLMGKEE